MLLSLLRWHWIQNIEQKHEKLIVKETETWKTKIQKDKILALPKEQVEN